MIGHPGHELRAYGWVAQARPRFCILTDGGGSDGVPRLDHSSTLLRSLGASAGPICGDLTDRAIYELVLNGNHEPFENLAERLARFLLEEQIHVVVNDGIEG